LADDGAGGEYVVSEVRSSFGHPSCATTSTETSFLAAKSDKAFMLAVNAAKTQESVSEYAALEKGLEFFCHM
jgi:hypothetical protein